MERQITGLILKLTIFLFVSILVIFSAAGSTGLMLSFSPKLAIFVVVSVATSAMLIVSPIKGLTILLFLAPIYNPSARFLRITGSVANVIFAIVFFAFFLYKLVSKKEKLYSTDVEIPIFIFLCWLMFRIVDSRTLNIGIKRYMTYLLTFLPFFLTVNIVETKKDLLKLLEVLFWGASIGAIYAVYTGMTGEFRGENRAVGAFGNPNALGNFMLLLMPIVWALFSYTPKKQRTIYKLRYFWFCLSVLTGLFSSGSKGAIIACGVSFIVLIITTRKISILLGLFSIIVLSIFFIPFLYETMGQYITQNMYSSIGARMLCWFEAIKNVVESPFAGIGLGNYWCRPAPYDAKLFDNPFNVFLLVASESGLIGLLLFFWFVYMIFIRGCRLIKISKDPVIKMFLIGFMASFIGNIVHWMIDDMIVAIYANWVFGVLLGFMYSIGKPGFFEEYNEQQISEKEINYIQKTKYLSTFNLHKSHKISYNYKKIN